MSAPRLDDQLCFQLYTASRLVTRLYRPHLEALGLTYPQYLVMMVLWAWDDAGETGTVSALGERLMLDSGTLSPLLKRLERAGFVERARSAGDERVVEVRLTDEGRALAEPASAVPEALLCRTGADVEGVAALRETLRGLVRALQGV